jgi:hypothetical protein
VSGIGKIRPSANPFFPLPSLIGFHLICAERLTRTSILRHGNDCVRCLDGRRHFDPRQQSVDAASPSLVEFNF